MDIYALISGYVWVYAKYRYRNIIELWLQVLFYTVPITVLFWAFVPSTVSAVEWLKAIFPVMFNQYWYFSSYVALFLFIPLLNEYSCGSKSRIRKFGNRSSVTRKSSFLCLITCPFLWGYLSRPCRICGA